MVKIFSPMYCFKLFGTLSSPLKARIIEKLNEKELTVSELSKELNEERSKVSHALLTLKKCGFVFLEKKGRNNIYLINKKTIKPLLKIAKEHVNKYCACNLK